MRDAREHGIEVRPVDINMSNWDATLESGAAASQNIHAQHAEMKRIIRSQHAVRLGFRQIKSIRQEDMEQLMAARGSGYDSVRDLWLRQQTIKKCD